MTTIAATGGVEIPEDVRRRVESSQKLKAALDAINEVYDDLSFWKRRIKRQVKFCLWSKGRSGTNYVTNAWSGRGNVSPEYLEALSKCLKQIIGPQLEVGRTHNIGDPLGIFEPKVVVYW